MKLVIVTGLSGSGKSVALHTLEDLDYYCIDNLPMSLLKRLAEDMVEHEEERFHKTAVGIDVRSRSDDLRQIPALVKGLRATGVVCEIIYLEAEDEVLIRRFSETRRKHPLSSREHALAEAIVLERDVMERALSEADLRIDTTHTTQHELRDIIRGRLDDRPAGTISLLFESFGFKYGVPRDVDFVYDLRCLPNPHWEPGLRSLTGRDPAVARFFEGDAMVAEMSDQLVQFLEKWIPVFERDGRNYLTIAFGCTGGQHRSVYMIEKVAALFRGRGFKVLVRHRELR